MKLSQEIYRYFMIGTFAFSFVMNPIQNGYLHKHFKYEHVKLLMYVCLLRFFLLLLFVCFPIDWKKLLEFI